METSETIITLGWPSETWIRYVGVKKKRVVACKCSVVDRSVGEKFSREARDKPKLSFYVDIVLSNIDTHISRRAPASNRYAVDVPRIDYDSSFVDPNEPNPFLSVARSRT